MLIAGGPNNDPTVEVGSWAFPDALVEVLGGQPLAADLQRDWKVTGRRAKVNRGSPWIELVAGIVGSTTDDLTDRIAKDERRRLQSIAAVAMVIATVVGASALVAGMGETKPRSAKQGHCSRVDLRRGGDAGRHEGRRRRTCPQGETRGPACHAERGAGAQFSAAVELANTIRIIETRDGVNGVAISPDGHRIAAAVGRTVCLWDTETGQPLGEPMSNTKTRSRALRSVRRPPHRRRQS